MTREQLIEHLNLDEEDADMILLDGLEKACIGTVEIGTTKLAAYDVQKCVDVLVDRDGMTRDDAYDFFYSNIKLVGYGEKPPAFFMPLELQ